MLRHQETIFFNDTNVLYKIKGLHLDVNVRNTYLPKKQNSELRRDNFYQITSFHCRKKVIQGFVLKFFFNDFSSHIILYISRILLLFNLPLFKKFFPLTSYYTHIINLIKLKSKYCKKVVIQIYFVGRHLI